MKGTIQPGHIGVNHYELIVVGAPPLVFTEISGFDSETTWVELPDRTQASGGEETVGEFTAMLPLHHTVERDYLDAWIQSGRDPVSPEYKKVATMLWKNIHGEVTSTFSLVGIACSKRTTPDAEMGNDGEMATNEYTFKYDSCVPLP